MFNNQTRNKRQKSKILAILPMLGQNKAQIGETTTWIIATIVIIAILTISIFISAFYFGNNKDVHVSSSPDFVASGSFFSWLLTNDQNNQNSYSQIQNQENLNDFNGPLAVGISNYSNEKYRFVWTGVVDNTKIFPPISNDYFLTIEALAKLPNIFEGTVIEEAILNENKNISLIMVERFEWSD